MVPLRVPNNMFGSTATVAPVPVDSAQQSSRCCRMQHGNDGVSAAKKFGDGLKGKLAKAEDAAMSADFGRNEGESQALSVGLAKSLQ